jgi:hypothetical protein
VVPVAIGIEGGLTKEQVMTVGGWCSEAINLNLRAREVAGVDAYGVVRAPWVELVVTHCVYGKWMHCLFHCLIFLSFILFVFEFVIDGFCVSLNSQVSKKKVSVGGKKNRTISLFFTLGI